MKSPAQPTPDTPRRHAATAPFASSPAVDPEVLAARCRRRLNAAILLERAAMAVAVCLAAVATAWIAAKMLAPERHDLALQALWLLVPAVLGAAWLVRARGELFSHREALVLADVMRHGDAELPARVERPDLFRAPMAPGSQRLPGIRWTTPARPLLPALAYFGVVFLISPSTVRLQPPSAILEMQLAELAERLEEVPLAEEERQELIRDIETMRRDGRAMNRSQWEAIETMRERVATTMEMMVGEMAVLDEAASAVAEALERLDGTTPLSNAALAQLAEQLGAAAGKLQLVEDPTLRDLVERAMSLCKNPGAGKEGTSLSKEQAESLKKSLSDLRKRLGECAGSCSGGGNPGDGEGNSERRPGQGGIDRGRGDAPLTLSDEPRQIDVTTDPTALARRYDDESYEVGVHYVPPSDELELGPRSVTIDVEGARGPGGDVRRTRISPARRDVVQRYFSDAPAVPSP